MGQSASGFHPGGAALRRRPGSPTASRPALSTPISTSRKPGQTGSPLQPWTRWRKSRNTRFAPSRSSRWLDKRFMRRGDMLADPQVQVNDPRSRALLLSALYNAQEQFGWLSPQAIQQVAEQLNLSPGQVHSTASFFTMFTLQLGGR